MTKGRKGSKRRGKKRGSKRRGNVYLGKSVPDIGRPGLDSQVEVAGIMGAIMEDWKKGRISDKTARGRLALLKLVAKRQGVRSRSLEAMLKSAMAKLRHVKKKDRGRCLMAEKKRGVSRGLSAMVLAEAYRLARRARSIDDMRLRLLAWRKVITGLGDKVDPAAKREALSVLDKALKELGVKDPAKARISWDEVPLRLRRMYERLKADKDK